MELTELFAIIKDELTKAGFTKRPSYMEEEYRSSWTFNNEAVDELAEGYSFARLSGYTLDVEKVPTHNAVQKSVSYYLSTMKWDQSTGHAEASIKISSSQTEATLRKKINAFIAQYKISTFISELEYLQDLKNMI